MLEYDSEDDGADRFKVKDGVRLHMYVSEPPCGDASMLELENGSSFHWTGAKPLLKQGDSGETGQSL